MTTFKMLRYPKVYGSIRRFRTLKDLRHSGLSGLEMKVSFGLWGTWYVVKGFLGLHCVNGSQMPIHTAHLLQFGPVIGEHDLTCADGTAMKQAWRESYGATIDERLGIPHQVDNLTSRE